MKIDYRNEKLVTGILEFLARKTDLHIIVSRCCACMDLIGVKLGHGVNGISDTYCGECATKFLNNHGNSAIWPLIGCLIVGGVLLWEYIYAIIKYLE